MRARALAVRSLGLVLTSVLLAGCVSLPENGPVEEAEPQSATREDGRGYDPPLPRAGATARDVVDGFFSAMTAVPVSTTAASEYLDSNARDDWDPQQKIITYDSKDLVGTNPVQVVLRGAEQLDARGAWERKLPTAESTLSLPIAFDGAERRIKEAPNALVVPRDWFNRHYRRLPVYFFDVSRTVLVPEPVFVPTGEQLASSLVRSLLQGPADGGDYIIGRTLVPSLGASEKPAVSVDSTGLAEVSLPGTGVPLSADDQRLLIAQLQWTLREDVTIDRLRVTVGERLLTGVDGSAEFDVDGGEQFDPAWDTPPNLYGVNGGRLGEVVDDTWTSVQGAFGRKGARLRHASVDLDGRQAAGVSENGRKVYLAETDERDVAPTSILSGTDILAPAWTVSGHLWMLDRTPTGARVMVYRNGKLRPINVTGISDHNVTDFLVSRDGSRLVAAVRGDRGRDSIVVSRVAYNIEGVPVAGMAARTAYAGIDAPLVVRDLAWSTPTDVLMLTQQAEETTRLSIVRLGSSVSDPPESIGPVLGNMQEVTSSPKPNSLIFCTAANGEVARVGTGHQDDALGGDTRTSGNLRVRGLTYVG